MHQQVSTARGELSANAPVLAAAFAGLLFSIGPIVVYTFGVFFLPLATSFEWTRTQVAGALALSQLGLLFASPLHGMLVDRLGVQRILPLSIAGLGAAMASLYWLTPSLVHFYACFLAMTLLGATASPIGYSRILVGLFDKRRGLALGLALAGVGVGAMLFPPATQYLIEEFGWRSAYLALGIVALLPLPLCSLVFNRRIAVEPAPAARSQPAKVASTRFEHGRTFVLLGLIFVAMGAISIGTNAHLIPLLIDSGISKGDAALVASVVGLCVILGRAGIGWVLDMTHAPYVLCIVCLGLAGACLLLTSQLAGLSLIVTAVLLGLGLGAEVDLLSFLVSRYWRPQSFGVTYGALFGVFTLGVGLGPLLVGMAFDRLGDYQYALFGAAACAVVVAGLCLALPRYDRPQSQSHPLASES